MNQISSWSIRNPIPTIVLFLALTLAGLISFSRLRQNNTPDMDIPTVSVSVSQPGAAPSELETQVARPIEDALAGLGNVDHVRTTINEGAASINVEFAIGVDVDRATDDVRNAVSSIRSELPADVEEPVIQRVDAIGQALLSFVVEAPGMAPDALSWFIDNDVAKAVLSVRGVSKITRSGGVDREIRVRLDPDRLAAFGVTAAEVSEQIKALNTDQPGGRTNLGGGEQAIRTLGSAPSVEALAASRINLDGGATIRLSDLGEVESSWAEIRQRARLDGREVIAFNVFRSVGSSEVGVAKAARARIASFAATHPGISIAEVSSSTDWVEEGYAAAVEALWLGAVLAMVVVWLFLRDARATLISGAALPLSLIPTFAVMHLWSQSLNNITLLAIALVVGILVDDAIVEIENIVRHMRQSGKSAYDAAIEAADEIGLAVVATTFTIVAVFVPVAFMAGIPGQFFRAFAIVVCCSVLFSLLVARMLTPLMSAYLMKPGGTDHARPAWAPFYLRLVDLALRRRWITLGLGVALFAGSISLARFIPSEFMTPTDRGRSMLSLELPPGSTLADTDAAVQQATALLLARPEVERVFATMGAETTSGRPRGGGGSAGEVRKATLAVTLKDRGERSLSQQEFEAAAGPELARIPGARTRFGADGASGAKLEATLVSDDGEALDRTAEQLAREMRTIPGLRNIASTSSLARPELLIRPLADKAAELGLSTSVIARTIDIATLGDADSNLGKFDLPDRQIPIRVMLAEEARADLATIAALQVRSGAISAPLNAVAEIGFGAGPNQIDRLDRRRTATIEAELSGLTTGEAFALVRALPTMRNLPPGILEQAAGDLERMQELTDGFALAIGSGIVLMLLVLVLLFRGFMQPLTILTALPFSVGGALGAILASGNAFSISALIGILMLMGIAAKNSILLVEYALMAQREGRDRRSALLDAAEKRAQPIIMTTVAMVAGMFPIALGVGADAESRAPMAIAVIGGLLSSTLLSLLFVPAIYTLMDDLERTTGGLLRRTFLPAPTVAPKAEPR